MTDFHADVFCGSENGILKGINIKDQTWKNITHIDNADKDEEICCFCWMSCSKNEFCYASKNRQLHIVESNTFQTKNVLQMPLADGRVKGIAVLNGKFISGNENGVVNVWNDEDANIATLNSGSSLFCLAQNTNNSHLIATGGKETDLKLWDLNSDQLETPIYQAKNVRNDWLNLRVPIWILKIKYFMSSDKILTSTGYHQLRIYDPKAQRRPVMEMKFDEYPITAMDISPKNDMHVIIGNTQGKMALVDLRKERMIHCFKGFAGGIRDIAWHSEMPYVASCGLDRFLRIHDVNTKELVHKFYLKSRLNCLLFSGELSANGNDVDEETVKESNKPSVDKKTMSFEEGSDEDDGDDIWNNMEDIKTKIPKRKGLTKQENTRSKKQKKEKPEERKKKMISR